MVTCGNEIMYTHYNFITSYLLSEGGLQQPLARQGECLADRGYFKLLIFAISILARFKSIFSNRI